MNKIKHVPSELTNPSIRLKAKPVKSSNKPVELNVKVSYAMPDELKLVIFFGLVATMTWMMLTTYVASFSKPNVIILDSTGQVIRP